MKNPLPTLTRLFRPRASGRPARLKEHTTRPLGESTFHSSISDGYRGLAQLGGIDCADPRPQQRAVEQCWLSNPLVGQIVSLLCDFTIGEGVTAVAHEPRVQDALDALISSQDDWESLQRAVATHLALYGEVFVAIEEGSQPSSIEAAPLLPRLHLILPTQVAACSYDSSGTFKGIIWERSTTKPMSLERLARHPFTIPAWGMTERIALDATQVIHVIAQAGLPTKRGFPELARILPWVQHYEQWLGDRVRINKARGAFAFLRKVPNWGIEPSASIRGSADGQQAVPRPGSVLVVNEQESWEVLEPRVGAEDASADGRALKLMILAGAGIAEHYVGDLSQSNLATAQAAELPMLKRFEAHQRRVISALRLALTRGLALMDVAGEFELRLPAPGLTDGLALTQTLQLQLQLGLISKQTARSLIPWVTDVTEEAGRVEQEALHSDAPSSAKDAPSL